ncbi:hypothetical protein BDZ94DRAFT_1209084 [Collybia nuda]|uniref:Uncharacterized protein n=1 Tax=Collybia nuda TaxID=64659 RepID=A0A9P5YHI4_9AGAR|nr:hypothetical protein BDZ94DRAFT_1209084 [Collybia nuda]
MLLTISLLMVLLPAILAFSWSTDIRDAVDVFPSHTNNSYLNSLSSNQRQLFEYAMSGLDLNFGPPFLFNSPRYSAWYAVGLLARARDNDVSTASEIIQQVISHQYRDPSKLWFGTFRSRPSDPDPSAVYPPQPYVSYDLNQGLFVCTSWIIIMEEFQHLLNPDVVDLMKKSMYNATVGDGYRVGGVDGDNLYPIYSNPWYMRVMAATYVGNMMSDSNMTFWGDEWARQALVEFDRFGTLSEFNSATYTGVSLFALSLWGYMPTNSTIYGRGAGVITKVWDSIGHFYNPTLGTLGGPWDRSYGFNMQSYFGILGAHIVGLIGGVTDNSSPIPSPLVGSEHYGDVAAVALIPLTSKFHDKYVSSSVRSRLIKLQDGGHAHFAQAVSPPFEKLEFPRNYTSWTGDGLSVGGIQVDSNVVGGPAINPSQFAPAVLLWSAGAAETGWISHYATSRSVSAVATADNLTISYPKSRAFPNLSSIADSSVMTFFISGFKHVTLDTGFLANGSGTLPGLELSVSGNVPRQGVRSFIYGAGSINDLLYYNLTFAFPDSFPTPEIIISFRKLH